MVQEEKLVSLFYDVRNLDQKNSLLLFKYLPHIGTIVIRDGALFDVIPLPSIRGTGLQVFTGLSLCAGKLLFSYLHHQTLTFNHLTSAFIRHKTSYPNQVSGLCSQRDPPVSTDHADSYVTYPSYDIFCNYVEPYIFKKSIERLATFRNNLYL